MPLKKISLPLDYQEQGGEQTLADILAEVALIPGNDNEHRPVLINDPLTSRLQHVSINLSDNADNTGIATAVSKLKNNRGIATSLVESFPDDKVVDPSFEVPAAGSDISTWDSRASLLQGNGLATIEAENPSPATAPVAGGSKSLRLDLSSAGVKNEEIFITTAPTLSTISVVEFGFSINIATTPSGIRTIMSLDATGDINLEVHDGYNGGERFIKGWGDDIILTPGYHELLVWVDVTNGDQLLEIDGLPAATRQTHGQPFSNSMNCHIKYDAV